MANTRLSMRRIKEVLRLYFEQGRAKRQIAQSIGVSPTTVGDYIQRAQVAGIGYPLPEGMDDEALNRCLFPPPPAVTLRRPEPDWPAVYAAMSKKGMTLILAWQEYKSLHPEGYQLSWFCEAYRRYVGRLGISLRQSHPAGRCFVDYAGQSVPVIDPASGEIRAAQIFVGVLGASNYTYAEATWSQQLPDWIGSHVRMFAFYGGVPEVLVPDNLKSGVRHACFYDPELNPTYREFAAYHGITVLPARPGKPRDKAKVEGAVLIVERWILARLRNRRFFSLSELNEAIGVLLKELNERAFKKLPGNRRELFVATDQPALGPLPVVPYEFAQWKLARVNIDCHIEVDGHYYSVPYRHLRQQVEVRLTGNVVEVFAKGKRIASHGRSFAKGRHTTVAGHLPPQHQKYLDWSPQRLSHWAAKIGASTQALIETILTTREHPQQGYRACLGILRLAKAYGDDRLEAACRRALAVNATSYRSLESMLKTGMDSKPLPAPAAQAPLPLHENVRGPDYYLH
jgi:transposase